MKKKESFPNSASTIKLGAESDIYLENAVYDEIKKRILKLPKKS